MSNNYVDNKKFFAAISERKTLLKEAKKLKLPKPKLTDYLGNCVLLICENLAYMPRFKDYPNGQVEEMKGDAIENCLRYFDNFNLKYRNPHAYFTKIAWQAFVRRIQKEKKTLYAKYKFYEERGVLGDNVKEETHVKQFQIYENISQFIKTYEDKLQEKKEKMALNKKAPVIKARKGRKKDVVKVKKKKSSVKVRKKRS